MNSIRYLNNIFRDANVSSGTLSLANSMVADTLEADTFTVLVSNVSDQTALIDADRLYLIDSNGLMLTYGNADIDLTTYDYGTPVEYYHNDELVAKFYLDSIKRVGRNLYEMYCVSAIGMLINIPHKGGIYTGTPAGDIIAELMGEFEYSIDEDVATVQIYGHLPYSNCRDNLHQVLFALGASITKSEDGEIAIRYMTSGQPVQIPMNRIGVSGKVSFQQKATRIDITEHAFYSLDSDKSVVLFDNIGKSTAVNQLVTFPNPCHDLVATGINIVESDVNYAIVNGNGTLEGKEYTHTTQIVSFDTEEGGEDKIVEVKAATLVSSLNSQNVSKRLGGYYTSAQKIDCDIVIDDVPINPATEVSFTDPFGDNHVGFINSMNINLSGILKSQTQITADWIPSHFGNNVSGHVVITATGIFDIPSGVETIRAILIGGGQGGSNGTSGEAGQQGNASYTSIPNGGAGGAGGVGGAGGKIKIVDINVGGASTLFITVGQGGMANGAEGSATIIDINGLTYSSDDGAPSDVGVVDIVSGEVYALKGEAGIAGSAGGGNENNTLHGNGYDLEADGSIWLGGTSAKSLRDNHQWRQGTTLYTREATATGGLGGGAAYGANGQNGQEGYADATNEARHVGGEGGKGATPIAREKAEDIGAGGAGGHGGGGGGAGGNVFQYSGIAYQEHTYSGYGEGGPGGAGGTGGSGGAGGDGGVILYY